MKSAFLIAAAGACVMLALAPITHAQSYPNKPVRLVDPYAPGGSTSVVSQSFSKKFQEFTDQPMVVDHKPGASPKPCRMATRYCWPRAVWLSTPICIEACHSIRSKTSRLSLS